ncbi:MAG: outer membrane protein transport protein [Lutibacter sp.]|nr:outer membrane protein transport protein [Lutibacter sp.]
MKNFLRLAVLLLTTSVFAQAGHIMQGVGSVNMSMGGAATAQPLDISGALQWNPAAISVFDSKIINFDIGAFFSTPELSSSAGPYSGITKDDRGVSPMPALAYVYGKEGSKHTFGMSAFGISGFGVTFPENMTNPISAPQSMGGFGHIESDYMLLQVGLTWAYEITENFSIGIQPTINYAALELAPNPISPPSFPVNMGGTGKGYPTSDKASAIGYGAQFGLFYSSPEGIKIGASYKTAQKFSDLEFKNTYLDGSPAPDVDFTMDYPAIISFGLGYSIGDIDLALDFRQVDYENTDGFAEKGWQIAESGPMTGYPTGAVKGFGWKNIQILSAGLQYKGFEKFPLRVGYTYSSNPIDSELAFFSIPATAVIKNAFQFGFSHPFNENFTINGVYHYGTSGDKTEGPMLSPLAISPTNPYGAVSGTKVGYEMTTSMVMLGLTYTFSK